MELHSTNNGKDLWNFMKLDLLESIDYLTKNAQQVQDQVLAEILQRNQNTEYVKRLRSLDKHENNGFNAENGGAIMTMNKDMFKRLVPIVEYDDIDPYIQQIANGDSSPILCAEKITEFLTSSGTSGGIRRLIPTIPEEMHRKKYYFSLIMAVINQYIPDLDKGKGLYFLFIKAEYVTPGGLPAKPVLTNYYKSQQFIDDMSRSSPYTSPIETILCPDNNQSMYCQMLCGLLQRDQVLRMGAIFASSFLRAIKFLENNWPALCDDIEQGNLSPTITHQSLREAVTKLLINPNRSLAESIRAVCSEESWQGIIRKIWPKTKYIEAIVTGTMSQYIPSLNFYCGDLPLVSSLYGSSECFFGINLNPLAKPSDVSYTPLPNMGYFEFIPLSDDYDNLHSKNPQIVDLTSVEVGKVYELVVTTYTGLYRYKVGDVLRVKGFHNSTPQFEFVSRNNVLLSIEADKTDEDCLHQAVTNAAKLLQLETKNETLLIDYTSYPDTSTIPGHYVIFWEVSNVKLASSDLLQRCCIRLEESLDMVYRELRASCNGIGPLEIRLVKEGTFEVLMDHFISQGSSFNQYKTPRCIKSSHVLDLLNSRVILAMFSPKAPSWTYPRVSTIHKIY